MNYGKSITLDTPYADTVARVRDALKEQGFGVLTEIDVTATMQAKLGEQVEDYVILGACNPPLAFRALSIDRELGLLLPCNVVVRAGEAGTIVEILDPQVMVTVSDQPELKAVADEAAHRLNAVLAALSGNEELADPFGRQTTGRILGPAVAVKGPQAWPSGAIDAARGVRQRRGMTLNGRIMSFSSCSRMWQCST